MFDLRVEGESVKGQLGKELLAELKADVEPIVAAAAQSYVAHAREMLSRRGTGRWYNRYIKTRRRAGRDIVAHQASSPGDPPAIDQGKLQKSIRATKPRWRGWACYARIGSRLPQASVLEFGGRVGKGVVLKPRPYMRPAEKMVARELDARLERLTAPKGILSRAAGFVRGLFG